MGRHSSDSDNDHHKKKKKKRRSRSRSRGLDSDSGSYSSSKHKKSKKSKKSRRSRSRSRGRHSRSRSRSRDRHRGCRRSRSRDRRRSRSVSKSRTYRSRSSSRTRSRRASVSPLRARSRRSRSRDRRSRSRSRTRKNRSRSGSPAHSKKVKEEQDSGLRDSVPGFDKMTPIEQAEVRMNLALKAAAAADQQLKEQGVFGGTSRGAFELSLDDQHKRVTAIEDIESDGFAQQAFTSNRVKSENNGSVVSPNPHLSGINGTGIVNATYSRAPIDDPNSVIHPSLYVSKEEKILRWKKKLITMRKRKLEGEAMS